MSNMENAHSEDMQFDDTDLISAETTHKYICLSYFYPVGG